MSGSLQDQVARYRVTAFPLPLTPDSYDPSQDTKYQPTDFGLPAVPDPRLQPKLHALWTETFGRPLRFLAEGVASGDSNPPARVPGYPARTVPQPPPPPFRFETSDNWSGAYLEAHDCRRFRQIWGRWTVPPEPKPPQAETTSEPGPYYCSTWIGLDGQRLYVQSALPQAGTEQEVTLDPKQEYPQVRTWAWVQWWVRGDPDSVQVKLPWFDVTPGDDITCVLTALDEHSVMCTFVNQSMSPPAVTAVRVDAPQRRDLPLLPEAPRYSISGAHAEWVTERRGVTGIGNAVRPLADYGAITFVSCYAEEVSGVAEDPFNPHEPAIERTLENAQYVRMFDRQYNPPRTAYISVPERIDDTSFRTTYVG